AEDLDRALAGRGQHLEVFLRRLPGAPGVSPLLHPFGQVLLEVDDFPFAQPVAKLEEVLDRRAEGARSSQRLHLRLNAQHAPFEVEQGRPGVAGPHPAGAPYLAEEARLQGAPQAQKRRLTEREVDVRLTEVQAEVSGLQVGGAAEVRRG